MPRLENVKHERFAQAIVTEEISATEAYRRYVSGGKCTDRTAEVAASKLLENGSEVAMRVSEMRKELEKKERISREDLQRWYEDIILAPPRIASEDLPICETVMTKCGPFTSLVSKKEAAAALTRLRGWNEPEKHKLEVEVIIGGNAESSGDD